MNILQTLQRFFFEPYRSIATKRRTVRYAFPAILVIAATLGAANLQSTNSATLSIETPDATVNEGDNVRLDVYVTATQPINTVDIAVSLPAGLVDINGIDTGESVITLWTVDPYVADNTVYFRGGTFRRGFVGRHLIASINTTALTSGVAQFSVTNATFYVGDGSGDTVSYERNDSTTVYIGDAFKQPNSDGDTGVTFTGEASVLIVTDIDGDGKVSLTDVSRFLAAWHRQDVIFDFNGDGRMTFRDFGIILTDSITR